MTWTIRHGDCRVLLAALEPDSIDSCPTDPPYGLGFMGRSWDSPDNVAFHPETWQLVLRVLKPGAHLLAFGGTRTFHRLTVAIEDAGFEVRDVLCWLYGQGFPKSLDVSKAIDKAAGAEREVVGNYTHPDGRPRPNSYRTTGMAYGTHGGPLETPITAPATPEAKQWDGWGTALAPSWEPVILARKPLCGTVAANVLQHGTGGLNIDGCRVKSGPSGGGKTAVGMGYGSGSTRTRERIVDRELFNGRWPPNVALDEEAAAAVGRQSGERCGAHGRGPQRYQNRGSGSTGVAAVLEGFRFLGLEQDPEAVRVARLRLHHCRPDDDEPPPPPQARQGRLF